MFNHQTYVRIRHGQWLEKAEEYRNTCLQSVLQNAWNESSDKNQEEVDQSRGNSQKDLIKELNEQYEEKFGKKVAQAYKNNVERLQSKLEDAEDSLDYLPLKDLQAMYVERLWKKLPNAYKNRKEWIKEKILSKSA